MKKYLLLLALLFLCSGRVWALDIVYPRPNPAKINASSTFFIGSTSPSDTLTINDVPVKVSPTGAFAQVVQLNFGLNNFKIISSQSLPPSNANEAVTPLNSVIDFTIERPQPSAAATSTQNVLIEYPPMNNFYVTTENAPLRMTPVDGGINRMSHLPKDMQLIVNGEKGSFYRVYLNSKLCGWISKSNVEQRIEEKNDNLPILIKDYKVTENKDFCIYEFDLDKKTPFVVKEENGLTLQLFNVKIAGNSQDKLGLLTKQNAVLDNTLTLNLPMKKLFGYDISFDSNKFILKVRKAPKINCEKPLKDIKISVDAGHGGSETGAIGCCGDKEKDINLAIAKKLEQELENRGAKVVMTRTDDVNVSLNDRVDIAKKNDATLLVSVHANALPDGADPNKCRGTSVYYYQNQAKLLADNILSSMTAELGTQNDKVRQGSLALVRPTSSVSVLVEVAYIINPDDSALLTDENFQTNCAKAIADGIEKYFLN